MNAVVTKDLTVWFGEGPDRVDAVKSVTLSVAEGESYGIVGESGSGKSTVLRAITGLIPTWSGGITVAGRALGPKRDRTFYKTVQMVFQDPYASLHPRMTVDAVLSEVLHLHGFQDIDARIDKLLREVGLGPGFRFRYPHQLSGGQRQRVAIARALAPEPRILLLDEPTSALDVSVQAEILNLLVRLREERGLTYIFVTHALPVVSFLCDRLGVLRGGQLVEEAPVKHLRTGAFENAYARELYAASLGAGDRVRHAD